MTKVPTPSLFAVALHCSCFSRETKHGLFSEAPAEDSVNAQGKGCTCRCELTFVLYQKRTLPQACQHSHGKGLWCSASGQTWCRQEQEGGSELEAAKDSPIDMELRWPSHTYYWKTPPAKSPLCPYPLYSKEVCHILAAQQQLLDLPILALTNLFSLLTEQLQGCLILIDAWCGSSCPVSPYY